VTLAKIREKGGETRAGAQKSEKGGQKPPPLPLLRQEREGKKREGGTSN